MTKVVIVTDKAKQQAKAARGDGEFLPGASVQSYERMPSFAGDLFGAVWRY